MNVRRLIMASVLAATLVLALGAYAVTAFNRLDETPIDPQAAVSGSPELIMRGAYLARIGDCVSCHTRPGGAAYAGGRAVQTPFGAVFAGNLTPDDAAGLGRWNADEFWRALHHGRSRDGRLLYPAFPYTDYTHVTRGDADAIFAFLRSLRPVTQPRLRRRCAFPTTRRRRWPSGVRCTSVRRKRMWRSIAAPIWSGAWGTAAPAIRRAMRSVAR